MTFRLTIQVYDHSGAKLAVLKCEPKTNDLAEARRMITVALEKKYGVKYGTFKELNIEHLCTEIPKYNFVDELFGKFNLHNPK